MADSRGFTLSVFFSAYQKMVKFSPTPKAAVGCVLHSFDQNIIKLFNTMSLYTMPYVRHELMQDMCPGYKMAGEVSTLK